MDRYTKPLTLVNVEEDENMDDMRLDFDDNGMEFGADNCATHHICVDKSLFIGEITPLDSIGVRCINGT